MIRAALLAAALLLAGGAHAKAECWPAQLAGAGTMVQHAEVNDAPIQPQATAQTLWWWCPGEFDWQIRLLVCDTTRLAECVRLSDASLLSTTDPVALRAAWDSRVRDLRLVDADGWIVSAWLRQASDRDRPLPPRWQVPPLSTATSRPAYGVKDGVRLTRALAGVRAPVRATCDCIGLVVREGSSRYCRFDGGQADQVALCRPAVSPAN